MPSRNKKKEIGRVQGLRQPDRQRVAFKVIDSGHRQIMDERNRLRRHQPRKHASDKTRPSRRGNAAQIAKPKVGFRHRGLDQAIEHLHVRASRDLGNDAAEGCVIGELRAYNIRKDNAVSLDVSPYKCSRRFIAARLNTEYG